MAQDRLFETSPGVVCPMLRDHADALMAYAERRLEGEKADSIARHAMNCAECRRVIDSQRFVWEAMDAWEPEAVSADFNRRLYRAIDEENARSWWRRLTNGRVFTRWNTAIPVAASCMVLLGFFLVRTPDPIEDKKQAMFVETVDVEKLDRALDDMDLLRELNQDLGDSRI